VGLKKLDLEEPDFEPDFEEPDFELDFEEIDLALEELGLANLRRVL
jgi:hypothetical protein